MVERTIGGQSQGSSTHDRAVSLAHRMLAGAGRAALVAYGLEGQPTLDALAHGMTGSGDLMVATTVLQVALSVAAVWIGRLPRMLPAASAASTCIPAGSCTPFFTAVSSASIEMAISAGVLLPI